MYRSVYHAVNAMIHYKERQRTPRGAPWPDHAPPGASAADRWRYVYCHATRPCARQEAENDRDPLIVLVLFARYDRRRALTRLFLEHQRLEDLPGQERQRARTAKGQFIRSITLATTMGPGIKLELGSTLGLTTS